jgi:type IV secretion system protein TrbL
MAAPTAGILDSVLNTFRTQIDSGFGALTGPVQGTFGAIIVISVASMAIMWAIDDNANIFGPLIRKVLLVGFWAYMILNWQSLAIAAFSAFGKLGIAAGGGAAGLSDFLNNPSKVFALGLQNAKAMLDFAAYSMGATNTQWGTPPSANTGLDVGAALAAALQSLVVAAEAMVCALVLIFAYGFLAIEVVVIVIEFHIVVLIAFCVLPFGVFSQTASYAERAIGYVISAGFKAMAIGVVIALGQTFLSQYVLTETPGSLPTIDTMCGMGLAIVVVLMLALSAPKYAAAVIGGAPTTGAGGAIGAGAGIVAATTFAVSRTFGAFAGASRMFDRTGGAAGGGAVSQARAAAGAVSSSSSPGAPRTPDPPSAGAAASAPARAAPSPAPPASPSNPTLPSGGPDPQQ